MTHEEYAQIAGGLVALAAQIEAAKRPAYTRGSDDVLANFKRVAAQAGLMPGHVLLVYAMKHWDAVCSALTDPSIPQAESVESRFADLINYLKLGYALLEEQGHGRNAG